jgi:Ca2+/Na+ antiporter
MTNRLLVLLLALISFSASGQENPGFMRDSAFMLPEAKVTSTWLNDTDRYRYNQMKFYVTTILPYLNASTKLFKEVSEVVNDKSVHRKERRRYVNTREDEMRTQFEDKIKELNTTQGALLVKLISRQTELNLYNILQEFKNPLTAIKWQAWARMNGMNLDRKYHPEEEKDLENIMDELGYPLPQGYLKEYVKG